MNTATIDTPFTRESEVLATVMGSFAGGADGWFYPRAEGVPLVRIQVADGRYRVERRRKPEVAWMLLVDADLAEFSADAFDTWTLGWALVRP